MTIKIRDIASGETHELPDDTPAVELGDLTRNERFEAHDTFGLVDSTGYYSEQAIALSNFSPGDECLIAGDEHRDDEPPTWWLSEVMP